MQKYQSINTLFETPSIAPPLKDIGTLNQTLPLGSCDCHAHLFGPQSSYPYKTTRSYTPHDATENEYRHLLKTLGFQRAVLVQPSVYGNDNSRLLDTLTSLPIHDDIQWRGIAVVDSSITDTELFQMHQVGIRGIRFNLLFKGGVSLSEIQNLAARVHQLGWHIQLLVDFSEIPNLVSILTNIPTPCVIDHLGHIPTHKGINNKGFLDLLRLIDNNRTWVKLSGFNRITQRLQVPFTDIDPFTQALINHSAHRCVFGTDWPHVQLNTPMPKDADLVNELLRMVPEEGLQKLILVENPKQLYGF